MKSRKLAIVIAVLFTLGLSLGLISCGQSVGSETTSNLLTGGGTLILRINPEIEISYDESGAVTKVAGRNEDGKAIVQEQDQYLGKPSREVVKMLIASIQDAGYLVEEIEGEGKTITIEIESGSRLPNQTFLTEIVSDLRNFVEDAELKNPIDVKGDSDYGSDYGVQTSALTSDQDDSNYGVTTADDTAQKTTGDSDYDDSDYQQPGQTTLKTTVKATQDDSDYDDSDYTSPVRTTAKPTTRPVRPTTNVTRDDSDYDDSDYSDYKTPSRTTARTTVRKTVKPTTKVTRDDSDYDDSDYQTPTRTTAKTTVRQTVKPTVKPTDDDSDYSDYQTPTRTTAKTTVKTTVKTTAKTTVDDSDYDDSDYN